MVVNPASACPGCFQMEARKIAELENGSLYEYEVYRLERQGYFKVPIECVSQGEFGIKDKEELGPVMQEIFDSTVRSHSHEA